MKSNSDDSPSTSKKTSSKIREYPTRELEEQSQQLLAATFPNGLSIPVDIEEVAFHLGLEINPIPGLRHGCQVLGAIWRDSQGKYWIVVDEHMMDNLEAQYRFTVAEEIAHYLLHKEHITTARTSADAVNLQGRLKDNYTFFESNTRRLAEGLLMPAGPLRKDAAVAYTEVVRIVNYRNLAAVTAQVTELLKRKYAVSFDAMRIRMGHYPLRLDQAIEAAFNAHNDSLSPSI